MHEVRVVCVGLGPVGMAIARALGSRAVAGVDLRSDLSTAEFSVGPSIAAWKDRADVAVVTTSSSFADAYATFVEALDAGLHVVSTCEEAAYPWLRHPQLARDIDALARTAGRVVIGTGVNPGFVMDRLAIVLTRVCVHVASIRIERIVEASTRRMPLQKKIGAGLPLEEWQARAASGNFGHVGLAESAVLVARGLGWEPGAVDESVQPVISGGTSLGVRQSVVAAQGRVQLLLTMALGAENPGDSIVVDGDPPISLHLAGGIQGERGTVGAVLDAITRVPALAPGLRTVLDLV